MSTSYPAAFAIIKHLRQRGISEQDAIAAVGEYGAALDDFLSARTDEMVAAMAGGAIVSWPL